LRINLKFWPRRQTEYGGRKKFFDYIRWWHIPWTVIFPNFSFPAYSIPKLWGDKVVNVSKITRFLIFTSSSNGVPGSEKFFCVCLVVAYTFKHNISKFEHFSPPPSKIMREQSSVNESIMIFPLQVLLTFTILPQFRMGIR